VAFNDLNDNMDLAEDFIQYVMDKCRKIWNSWKHGVDEDRNQLRRSEMNYLKNNFFREQFQTLSKLAF
jgi:aspartyl/asparaginyl-tRNA synthetase